MGRSARGKIIAFKCWLSLNQSIAFAIAVYLVSINQFCAHASDTHLFGGVWSIFLLYLFLEYLLFLGRNSLHRRVLTSSPDMGSRVFVRLVTHLFWVKWSQEWNLTCSVRLFMWFVWATLINCLVLFMFICVNSKRKSHLNQPAYLSALLSAVWNLKIRRGGVCVWRKLFDHGREGEESFLDWRGKLGMESFSYSL